MYNFEKLTVWQKAMDNCELIYKETKKFPKKEMFGLSNQLLRRATTSIIPLNIAEGSVCVSKREFKHFLNIAQRSQYEVATTIRLSKRLGFRSEETFIRIDSSLGEFGRLLHRLIRSITI